MRALNSGSQVVNINNNNQQVPANKIRFYLNVGINYIDEESGEECFVRLPYGIALDNLKERVVTNGMSPAHRQESNMFNKMIRTLHAKCLDLDEGEAEEGDALIVEIFHRNSNQAEAVDDGELLDIFSGKKKKKK